MKVSKLVCKGCISYWCYAINTQEKEEKIEDIHVVCELREVFPEELLGLPPQRKIDFEIEFIFDA